MVAVQRLAQRAEQRDRARDGGLVVEVGTAFERGVVDRATVLGEQRLVRGDHALTGPERLGQPGPSRFDATDDLDHHVDIVALDQPERVRREQALVQTDGGAVTVDPADGDADDLQGRADPRGEVGRLLTHETDHLRTDRATTEQRDPDRL